MWKLNNTLKQLMAQSRSKKKNHFRNEDYKKHRSERTPQIMPEGREKMKGESFKNQKEMKEQMKSI